MSTSVQWLRRSVPKADSGYSQAFLGQELSSYWPGSIFYLFGKQFAVYTQSACVALCLLRSDTSNNSRTESHNWMILFCFYCFIRLHEGYLGRKPGYIAWPSRWVHLWARLAYGLSASWNSISRDSKQHENYSQHYTKFEMGFSTAKQLSELRWTPRWRAVAFLGKHDASGAITRSETGKSSDRFRQYSSTRRWLAGF